jgi:hypothetical protein
MKQFIFLSLTGVIFSTQAQAQSVTAVAETGTPVRTVEAPRAPWQPETGQVDFTRFALEYHPPKHHPLFVYVAAGQWDNLKDGWHGPATGEHTKFAVVGLGLRSKKHPKKGDVVFQVIAGVGRTWDRDQVRTAGGHIFEGQASATYQVSDQVGIRVGYAHYSTGEGVGLPFFRKRRNAGEGRLTVGVAYKF